MLIAYAVCDSSAVPTPKPLSKGAPDSAAADPGTALQALGGATVIVITTSGGNTVAATFKGLRPGGVPIVLGAGPEPIAVELARSVYDPFLYNHVMRSWLFAANLAQEMKTAPDPELVAAAALLHDLGLTAKYAAQARFEVDGANAARSFLQARGVTAQQIQLVWDAIALHAHGTIALYKGPEVSVIFEGVNADAVGYAFDRIPQNQMKSILGEFPRLGMKREIAACFSEVAREKPETTYDNGLREFGLRFAEGSKVAVTGPDSIANAPFED